MKFEHTIVSVIVEYPLKFHCIVLFQEKFFKRPQIFTGGVVL